MSYCVNCGVELADSERACPLCGVEVINPAHPYDPRTPKPFLPALDLLMPPDNRKFLSAVITLLLSLPAAVCLACDLAYTGGVGWSVLVAGAMAALWIFIVPMLLLRRHKILLGAVLDTGALLMYLWLVERFVSGGSWFREMALPMVLLLAIIVLVDYLLISYVVHGKFRQAALGVASTLILLFGIEICVNRYLGQPVRLSWSLIVAIPCVILTLLLLILGRRERFKAQMKKRLHL